MVSSFFFFNFWTHPEAYGTLVPRPGTEPTAPAMGDRVLTTGPPGSPRCGFDLTPQTIPPQEAQGGSGHCTHLVRCVGHQLLHDGSLRQLRGGGLQASGHFGPSGQQGHQGSFTGSSLNQRKGQQGLPTAARESSLNVRDVMWDLPIFLEDAPEIVKPVLPGRGKGCAPVTDTPALITNSALLCLFHKIPASTHWCLLGIPAADLADTFPWTLPSLDRTCWCIFPRGGNGTQGTAAGTAAHTATWTHTFVCFHKGAASSLRPRNCPGGCSPVTNVTG